MKSIRLLAALAVVIPNLAFAQAAASFEPGLVFLDVVELNELLAEKADCVKKVEGFTRSRSIVLDPTSDLGDDGAGVGDALTKGGLEIFQQCLANIGPRLQELEDAFGKMCTKASCTKVQDAKQIQDDIDARDQAKRLLDEVEADKDAMLSSKDRAKQAFDDAEAKVLANQASPPMQLNCNDKEKGHELAVIERRNSLDQATQQNLADVCETPNSPVSVRESILHSSECYMNMPDCVQEFDFGVVPPEDYSQVSTLTDLTGVKPGRTLKALKRCDEAKGGLVSVEGSRLSIKTDPVTNQVRNYDNADQELASGELMLWMKPKSGGDEILSANNLAPVNLDFFGTNCGDDQAGCGLHGLAVEYRIPIVGNENWKFSGIIQGGVVYITGASKIRAEGADIDAGDRVRPWVAAGVEVERAINEKWSVIAKILGVVQPGAGVTGMLGVRYKDDDGPEFTFGPTFASIPDLGVAAGKGLTGGRSRDHGPIGNVGMPFGVGFGLSIRWEFE